MTSSPMTAEDWEPMLQRGETLLWSGSASLRTMWPMSAMGLILFGGGVWLFWQAVFFRGSMHEYCAQYYSSKCGMVYALRWPGLAGSTAFVLSIFFIQINYRAGWMQQDYAVTNLRAIKIDRKKWRNPPEHLRAIKLVEVTPKNTPGMLTLGGRSSMQFIGLSRSQRKLIISLIDDALKESNP